MKIKTPIEFETFNDGIIKIYQTDEDDKIKPETVKEFHFGSEKIGVNRYFSALANDVEISQVIHVHKDLSLRTDNAAVIGKTRFKIIQIQFDDTRNPPVSVLSLSQRGLYIHKGADDEF